MDRIEQQSKAPTKSAIRNQLAQILSGKSFDTTIRSRDFLRFVVEETLAGNERAITQYAIATQVFGRAEDFDPTCDPIVRIQAGRLRRSLERYYLLDGVGDSVVIEVPKGTYVPAFRTAESGKPGVAHAAVSPLAEAVEDGGDGSSLWPIVTVQPFRDLTGDPERAFQAQGMTAELCLELGRYQDLQIIPLQGDPPPAVPNARFCVNGLLRKEGEVLVMSVALTDARSGVQIWSESYHWSPSVEERMEFQRRTAQMIAARIADEQGIVHLTLSREALKHPPSSSGVYEAILRYYQYDAFDTRENLLAALTALQRAVAIEPDCGLACAMLARLIASMYSFGFPFEERSLEETLVEAHALALRAVRLEPMNQRARAIMSFAHLLSGDLAAGRRDAELALALNPSSLCFLDALGYVLVLLGDWERGTNLVRQAIRLNPGHRCSAHYALFLDAVRREDYVEAYQEALQCRMHGDLWAPLVRAVTLGQLGRRPEAEAAGRELLELRPDFPGKARWLISRYVKFEELVERLVEGLRLAGVECE